MRASQLSPAQRQLLDDWARNVVSLFRGEVPYLVGSVLDRFDYRDVDVRLILDDDFYDRLSALVDVRRLGAVVSMWGWRQTDNMNLDFQIQRSTEANSEFSGRRHAIGLPVSDQEEQ